MRWGWLLVAMGCASAEPVTTAPVELTESGEESPVEPVAAESEPEALPDPHPVVAGFEREIRAWMTADEAAALTDLELTGTAEADTEKLTELVRHVLFRELGGTAILRLGIADIREYGDDVRAMPADPAGDPDDPDRLDGYGGYGAGPHANIDGMGNVVGDLNGQCTSSLTEAEREAEPNRCDTRFVPIWATVKLAFTAYLPIDVDTMGFVDPGTPMGDGEWDRAPPRPLRELLAIAERAGLEREFVVGVVAELRRQLNALAHE